MRRRKPELTLGNLIQAIAQFSRDDYETKMVVADLTRRGIVRLRTGSKQHRPGDHGR